MKPTPRRRRKPRTIIGNVIRAWPWVRFALPALRFVRRRARALQLAAAGGLAAFLVSLIRRARHRRGAELPTYSPTPEPHPAGFGGGTRETGYEAGPGTETERRLEAEKA